MGDVIRVSDVEAWAMGEEDGGVLEMEGEIDSGSSTWTVILGKLADDILIGGLVGLWEE